jgi:6-phosphogluconolactonase
VRRVAVVEDAPKPPAARITITPPVIEAARSIVVLATGEAKAVAVARALEGELDPARTPAQLARRGTWILDRAAASKLSERSLA